MTVLRSILEREDLGFPTGTREFPHKCILPGAEMLFYDRPQFGMFDACISWNMNALVASHVKVTWTNASVVSFTDLIQIGGQTDGAMHPVSVITDAGSKSSSQPCGEYSLLGGEKSFCDEKNSYQRSDQLKCNKMKKKRKLAKMRS